MKPHVGRPYREARLWGGSFIVFCWRCCALASRSSRSRSCWAPCRRTSPRPRSRRRRRTWSARMQRLPTCRVALLRGGTPESGRLAWRARPTWLGCHAVGRAGCLCVGGGGGSTAAAAAASTAAAAAAAAADSAGAASPATFKPEPPVVPPQMAAALCALKNNRGATARDLAVAALDEVRSRVFGGRSMAPASLSLRCLCGMRVGGRMGGCRARRRDVACCRAALSASCALFGLRIILLTRARAR